MILIRFTIIFLVVLGLYYLFVYRNLEADYTKDEPLAAPLLYEGLDEYPYLCYLPKGYGSPETSFPLILYLHHSSHGVQEAKYKVLTQSPLLFTDGQRDFPFVIAAPIDASGEWDVSKLLSFFLHIKEKFYVDSSKMYLTGFHDGASAAWMFSTFYPDVFAAMAAVAGTGDPQSARHTLSGLPVWIFHGKRDGVVPVENSLLMVGALKDDNPLLHYTLYADKGHEIWTDVYNTPELYDWFLQFPLRNER